MNFKVYRSIDYVRHNLDERDPLKCKKVIVFKDNGEVAYEAYVQMDPLHGYEYFYVRNKNHPTGLFSGCIKDAVECIRSGEGDAITHGYWGELKVIRLLDRSLGERLRKNTNRFYKNATFAYTVIYGNHEFDCYISKDMNRFDDKYDTELLKFKTRSEAQAFVKDFTELIKEWSELWKSKQTRKEQRKVIGDFKKLYSPNKRDNLYVASLLCNIASSIKNKWIDSFRVIQVVDKM